MRQPVPFGKYLLLDRISVGGMAEVFKAKSYGVEGFEKIIAIKRILPTMGEDRDFIKMFIDEAKIAGQLAHANICQIFELGRIDGSHFIAMEYIWGKDLLQIQNRLRKIKQAMPVPMACFVIAKVLEGLDYAHRKRDPLGRPLEIVHRDCSPQNVLVSYEGEVKIIDFGIAKATSRNSRTMAGVLKGKFGYMSPEQVRGLPLDRRSDIFALGTMLYECLTSDRLFQGETDFSTLEKVRNVDVQPPRAVNPNIPEAVERVILKALAKDVEDRYQWCSEMLADLQAFLMSQEVVFTAKSLSSWLKDVFQQEIERERQQLEQYKRVGRDGLIAGVPAAEAKLDVVATLGEAGPVEGDPTTLGGPSFDDIEHAIAANPAPEVGPAPGSPAARGPSDQLRAPSRGDGDDDFGEEAPTEIFGEIDEPGKPAPQPVAARPSAPQPPSRPPPSRPPAYPQAAPGSYSQQIAAAAPISHDPLAAATTLGPGFVPAAATPGGVPSQGYGPPPGYLGMAPTALGAPVNAVAPPGQPQGRTLMGAAAPPGMPSYGSYPPNAMPPQYPAMPGGPPMHGYPSAQPYASQLPPGVAPYGQHLYESGPSVPVAVDHAVARSEGRKKSSIVRDIAIGVAIAAFVLGGFLAVKFFILDAEDTPTASASPSSSSGSSLATLAIEMPPDITADLFLDDGTEKVATVKNGDSIPVTSGQRKIKLVAKDGQRCEEEKKLPAGATTTMQCTLHVGSAGSASGSAAGSAATPAAGSGSAGSGSAGSGSAVPSVADATKPDMTKDKPDTTKDKPDTTKDKPDTTKDKPDVIRKPRDPDRDKPKDRLPPEDNPADKAAAMSGKGFLVVTSSPVAKISIDGAEVGSSDALGKLPLAPGRHKVTYALGGDKYTFTITIKAGETTKLHKDLQ